MTTISADKIALVRTSLRQIIRDCPNIVEKFYNHLFAVTPEFRIFFPHGIIAQTSKFEAIFQFVLTALEEPEMLVEPLHDLGAQHAEMGVKDEQYPIVRRAFLETLAANSQSTWTLPTADAWGAVLEFITQTMLEGAHRNTAI